MCFCYFYGKVGFYAVKRSIQLWEPKALVLWSLFKPRPFKFVFCFLLGNNGTLIQSLNRFLFNKLWREWTSMSLWGILGLGVLVWRSLWRTRKLRNWLPWNVLKKDPRLAFIHIQLILILSIFNLYWYMIGNTFI